MSILSIARCVYRRAITPASGDVTPPTTPGTPTVSGLTSSSANIAWTASTDSGGSGLVGYRVYRSLNGSSGWTLVQSPSTNSVTDTGLAASTTYYYYVQAVDGATNVSSPSGVGSGTTLSGTTNLKGENVGSGQYWHQTDMWINKIDNAPVGIELNAYVDATTGNVTVPAGQFFQSLIYDIAAVGALHHRKIYPGVYQLKWSGTASNTQVYCDLPAGWSATTISANRIDITCPAEGSQTGGQLILKCLNGGGSSITMIAPSFVHTDDVSAFEGGQLVDPRFKLSSPTNLGIHRPIHAPCSIWEKLLDPTPGAELTAAQLLPSLTNSWTKNKGFPGAAKVALELGCNALAVNHNCVMTQAAAATLAAQVFAVAPTLKIVSEVGLETPWNTAYPYVLGRTALNALVAPGITIVDGDGNASSGLIDGTACAAAEKCRQFYEAWTSVYPANQVIPSVCPQTDYYDICAAMYHYKRGGVGLTFGAWLVANGGKTALNGYVIWSGTETMWDAGVHNYTPAQFTTEMNTRLAATVTTVASFKSQQTTRAPFSNAAGYFMYEGGHHVAAYNNYAVAVGNATSGSNVVNFDSSISGRITTGEFMWAGYYNLFDVPASPYPNQGGFARVVTSTQVTIHASAADASANTAPVNAGATRTGDVMVNGSRSKAVGDAFYAWFNSGPGVTWSQKWWDDLVLPHFDSYRILFEPKQPQFGPGNLWTLHAPPNNVHNADGAQLAWWKGVS